MISYGLSFYLFTNQIRNYFSLNKLKMIYKASSKLKTYLGIGIIIFFITEISVLPINNFTLALGALLLVWTTIEDIYYFITNTKSRSLFNLISDILVYSILLFFLVIKLFDEKIWTHYCNIVIILIFALFVSIILYIINIIRIRVKI